MALRPADDMSGDGGGKKTLRGAAHAVKLTTQTNEPKKKSKARVAAAGERIPALIHIGGATALYGGDWNHKSDPYVNLHWGNQLVATTRVLKDDANPVWNQTLEFTLTEEEALDGGTKLRLEARTLARSVARAAVTS